MLTNSRGAYASVSLWDKGGVTKVELSGVRMAKRLTLWGMCYSGFDSDHDGVELLMTLIRHVHREVRAKGVGYLSAFLPSELPIAQGEDDDRRVDARRHVQARLEAQARHRSVLGAHHQLWLVVL